MRRTRDLELAALREEDFKLMGFEDEELARLLSAQEKAFPSSNSAARTEAFHASQPDNRTR